MSAVTFEYKAIDKLGARHKGALPAGSEAEAFRKVSAMGLTPLSLRSASREKVGRRARRIQPRDLAHFTYQLGVLVSSRIPISEGLRSIAEQERPGGLRDTILDVTRRIESGQQVAAAMDASREVFGEVYIETIRAAEQSGNLVKVLEQLSESLERGQEMTRQVRGALMYPLCVSGILVLAVIFLVQFVVPRIAKTFESRHVHLPVFTRALVAAGESAQHYWWAYTLAAAAVIFAGIRVRRSPRGAELIDDLLGRVPHLGDILRGLAVARFTRILGLSISSGLGLIESLELAGKASGRVSMQRDAHIMAAQVRRGGKLSEVLGGCRQISGFTRRMLSAGEQSAELPRMCAIISRHYERESGHMVKNIATVIEPLMIVGIAGVVLVIALAIFLPMWDMLKLVG